MQESICIEKLCKRIYAGGDVPKDRFSEVKTEEFTVPIYANAERDEGLYGYTDEAREYEPSVTVAARGTIGYTAIRTEPFVPVVRLITVVPKQELVDLRYMYYALKSCKPKSSGTSIPQLTVPDIKKYSFGVPSKDEQIFIVGILDSVQNIIDKRRKEIEELDNLIKSRFIELFDTDEYPKVPISKLVVGKVQSVKKVFSPSDEIKYIDISSIDNKRNVMTGYTEYVLSEAPSRAQQHIKTGDIVISTVRPNLRNVAMTEFEDDNLVASSGFCVLRAAKCLPEYLLAIVCSDKFTDDMTKVVTGANYPAIKDSDVMNYQVAMPPMELQKEFAEFVHQVDKLKVEVQKSLDETQQLMDSLMQKYFG